MSTLEVEINFDSKCSNRKEKSYYNELMSFFKTGIIPRLTHSQFGFDDLCYYAADEPIPTEKQMKALKDRLHLMISIAFCEKKMEATLKEYVESPSKYREDLGKEFSWVKVSGDAAYFPIEKKPDIRNFDHKMREVLIEFDPLMNNT